MYQTPIDFFFFLVAAGGANDDGGDVWLRSVLSVVLFLIVLIFQGDRAQK